MRVMIPPAPDKGRTVSNSAFLAELSSGAPPDSTLWVTSFVGSPDLTNADNWYGKAYKPAVMAAQVDGWGAENAYFCVAALVGAGLDGHVQRRKPNFKRLLALVVDDIDISDVQGWMSWVIETSPNKFQVGILIDPNDRDAARVELVERLVAVLAEKGFVRADPSGNNIVRYVRLPVGANLKKRDSGPFTHVLHRWDPTVRMSLEDAAGAFGINLDSLRANPLAAQVPDPIGGQDERLRLLIARIVRGESLHDSINLVAASMVACGTQPGAIVNVLRGLMESSLASKDDRWQARYEDIPRSVSSAQAKFARPVAEVGRLLSPEGGTWLDKISDWRPPRLEELQAIAPMQWLLEGWIQDGLAGVMVAEGSTGKTTLLMHLMCCIAVDRPFMGCPVKAGASVLLSLDDPQGDLNFTLAQLLLVSGYTLTEQNLIRTQVRVISLRGVEGVAQFTQNRHGTVEPTGVELKIIERLSGIADLRLVMLDTLRTFSGADSSDERAMSIQTRAVSFMADQLRCVGMFAHHTGKGQSRDKTDDMYIGAGSAAIADNLRFVLRLKVVSDLDARLEFDLADLMFPPGAQLLRLSSQRGSLRVITPPPMLISRDGHLFRPMYVESFKSIKAGKATALDILMNLVDTGMRYSELKDEFFKTMPGKALETKKRVFRRAFAMASEDRKLIECVEGRVILTPPRNESENRT